MHTMSLPPDPRRARTLPSRWLAALTLAALSGAAQAKSMNAQFGPVEAAAAPAAPWWSAFHEPPLAALQQDAAAHAAKSTSPVFAPTVSLPAGSGAPLELQVAADYIGMRSLSVRAMLADEMLRSIARQRELMAGTAPLRSQTPALTALDAQLAQARRRVADLATNRDALVADLARLCGVTAATMQAQLQPALTNPAIPLLDAPPPAGPPTPRARDGDVFDALQTRDLEARRVALQTQWERTRTWTGVVRTRQLELDAARQRQALGAQPEFSVLATYRTLLVDSDRLADAAAELCKAWLQWHLQDAPLPLQASGRLSD